MQVLKQDDLVEVRASISLSYSPATIFAEALRAGIFQQPWAEMRPILAEELFEYLLAGLDNLLQRYPDRVSLEDLMAKVVELLPLFPGFANPEDQLAGLDTEDRMAFEESLRELLLKTGTPEAQIDILFAELLVDPEYVLFWRGGDYNLVSIVMRYVNYMSFGWQGFDFAQLIEELPDLYLLFSWNPEAEQALIQVLDELLAKLDVVHIGTQVVPVPFKDHFVIFLNGMKTRQEELNELEQQYFGDLENGDGLFERWNNWISDWWVLKAIEKAGIIVGKTAGFAIKEGAELTEDNPLLGGYADDAANFLREDALDIIAAVPSLVVSAGEMSRNFQLALETDPWWTLYGVLIGMTEASPLGQFIDIGIALWDFYAAYQNQQLEALGIDFELPKSGLENWHDMFSDNAAFQAGAAMGRVGMSVSDVTVGIHSAAGGLSGPPVLRYVWNGNAAAVEQVGVMSASAAQALGLLSGLRGVVVLSTRDNSGDSNDQNSEPVPPEDPDDFSPQIHEDSQGKHVPGHKNFDPQGTKSVLTYPNPRELLDNFAGTGRVVRGKLGEPGCKEIIDDFGEIIGSWYDPNTNTLIPTHRGTIHYSKRGAHIVPSNPNP